MKKFVLAAALASISLGGCATYPNQYGYNQNQGYYDSYGQWHPAYNNGYNNNGQLGNAATGAVGGAGFIR